MTYTEQTLGFRRNYSLQDGTLVIEETKWFNVSFRQEISLRKVKPLPDEYCTHDETTRVLYGLPGLAVFLLGAFCGGVLYERSPVGFYATLGAGLAGMLAAYIFCGRVRMRIFKGHEELPLFAVADRGRSKAEFDAFVTALSSHIANAKNSIS